MAGGQLPVGGGLKTVCGSVEPGQEEQRQLRKNERSEFVRRIDHTPDRYPAAGFVMCTFR